MIVIDSTQSADTVVYGNLDRAFYFPWTFTFDNVQYDMRRRRRWRRGSCDRAGVAARVVSGARAPLAGSSSHRWSPNSVRNTMEVDEY